MPPFFQLPLLRRSRTADFMTPGINPDAELPEIPEPARFPLRTPPFTPARMPEIGADAEPPPRPLAMPDMGNAPLPEFRPPLTRGDEYYGRKAEYLAGAPGRGKSALVGALEALGRGEGLIGAAAGGLTGAISPRRLREQQFEQRVRPQMLERFAFEDQARAQQAREAKAAEESALNRARIEEIGSQNVYRTGQLGVAQENVRRQGQVAQSQIDLNAARAEAAKRGTPVYQDIDEGGGKIAKYAIFPDGSTRRVGASGAAAISQANIRSREGIAARRESGANARADRRATGKGKKYAAISDIRDAVKQAKKNDPNMTTSRMKAIFKAKGYEIVED